MFKTFYDNFMRLDEKAYITRKDFICVIIMYKYFGSTKYLFRNSNASFAFDSPITKSMSST